MKSIFPISTSLRATNCRASLESAPLEVEYFFMGNDGQHRQITESIYDFRNISIHLLNAKPQLDARSGRYR